MKPWKIVLQVLMVFYLRTIVLAVDVTMDVAFEDPGELAGNFSFIGVTGQNRYTQTTGTGTGNSGAVDFTAVSTDATTALFSLQSFDFSELGSTLQISMFVLATPINGGVSGLVGNLNNFLEVGFSANDTTGFGMATPGNHFMSVGMVPSNTSGNSYYVYDRIANVSGGSSTRNLTGNPNPLELTPGHYYKLTGEFTNLGVDPQQPTIGISFLVTATLDDYGADGMSNLGIIFSRTETSYTGSNGTLGNDNAVWAGFMGSSANGADSLDNFSVTGPATSTIPEPSTSVLLIFSLFGCGFLLRHVRAAPCTDK